jgi:hypothetical protein
MFQHNSAENNSKYQEEHLRPTMLLLHSHFQSFLCDMFCLAFFLVSWKLAYFTINLCLLSVGLVSLYMKICSASTQAAAGDPIMQLRFIGVLYRKRFIGVQEYVRADIVFHTHQGVILRIQAFHPPALNPVPIIQPKRPITVCADGKLMEHLR